MSKKTQRLDAPCCCFCGRSGNGVQFNIFSPRFSPFGTACVDCERDLPEGTVVPRYDIIESKRWEHVSGRTASIHGALPWSCSNDKADWTLRVVGWTVRNRSTGAVGIGRKPFSSREEAQAWLTGKAVHS